MFAFFPPSSEIVLYHFSDLKWLPEWSSRHRVQQQKEGFPFWQLWTHHKFVGWLVIWRLVHFPRAGNVNSSFFKPTQDLRSCCPLKMRPLITEPHQERSDWLLICSRDPTWFYEVIQHEMGGLSGMFLSFLLGKKLVDSHLIQACLIAEIV